MNETPNWKIVANDGTNRRSRAGWSSFPTSPSHRRPQSLPPLCAEHADSARAGFLRSPFPQSLAPGRRKIGREYLGDAINTNRRLRSTTLLPGLASLGRPEAASFRVASHPSTRLSEAKTVGDKMKITRNLGNTRILGQFLYTKKIIPEISILTSKFIIHCTGKFQESVNVSRKCLNIPTAWRCGHQ